MNISILTSSQIHPVDEYLQGWIKKNNKNHDIKLAYKKSMLTGGDLLFLISCNEIISLEDRQKYLKSLVIHASDLPKGRGWSPHIWQIINGAEELTITLLEAEDKIDSGDIWHKIRIKIPKDALWYELNQLIFEAELKSMDFALKNFQNINPRKQSDLNEATYYSKRSPEDSELDPEKNISEQFNLMRVCDPGRFPAFIKIHGHRYKITLEKIIDE